MARTAFCWDPDFGDWPALDKAAFLGRPVVDGFTDPWDGGGRMLAPFAYLRTTGVLDGLGSLIARPATDAELRTVHSQRYLATCRERGMDPHIRAARLAAGAAVVAVDAIWSGAHENAYVFCRPAGHHAESSRGVGGCVFSNSGLAAKHARAVGAERVAIIDWDAHHGNGPQEIFWDDQSVLTISIHQDRAWEEGTGGVDALGGVRARGSNVNVPLLPGAPGAAYHMAMDQVIAPLLERFRPDLLVISSGFDASHVDPAARQQLHSGDFHRLTRSVLELASRCSNGRAVFLHEGGYSVSYTSICLGRVLEALAGVALGVSDPFLEHWGADFAGPVRDSDREVTEGLRAELDL